MSETSQRWTARFFMDNRLFGRIADSGGYQSTSGRPPLQPDLSSNARTEKAGHT